MWFCEKYLIHLLDCGPHAVQSLFVICIQREHKTKTLWLLLDLFIKITSYEKCTKKSKSDFTCMLTPHLKHHPTVVKHSATDRSAHCVHACAALHSLAVCGGFVIHCKSWFSHTALLNEPHPNTSRQCSSPTRSASLSCFALPSVVSTPSSPNSFLLPCLPHAGMTFAPQPE